MKRKILYLCSNLLKNETSEATDALGVAGEGRLEAEEWRWYLASPLKLIRILFYFFGERKMHQVFIEPVFCTKRI